MSFHTQNYNMPEQDNRRSVLGKRLREQPSKSFHHKELPSITEYSARSSSEENKQDGSAKKLRTNPSSSNAGESSQHAGRDDPVSERTNRAHRRASLVSDTVSRTQTRSFARPDRKRVAKDKNNKTRRSTQAAERFLRHVSDASNPHSSRMAHPTRPSLRRKYVPPHLGGNVVKSSKVIKALKEYKEAEAALSPLWSPYAIRSPTVENNMFSRQLSVSEQGQNSPKPSPHAGNQSSRNIGKHSYVESESESPQFAKSISENGATRKRSIEFASPPSPSQEIIDHNAPLAEFTRRISHAALALGKRGYDSASSDDASSIEEIPIGKPGTLTTVDAAESSIAATLKEMMEGVLRKLQKQDEKTRITEERMRITEERIKLESQRLATMIATQPPSEPPQAQASQERELLYQLAKTAALYGAEKARVVYQNTFCGGNLPTMVQLRELVPDVDQTGNSIHPALMWQMLIEPQQFPQYFYSTRPWIADPWRSTLTVPRTQEEIFSCLKADEARYRSAYWASSIQMKLGGNIERQDKSRFPLRETVQRALRSQLQQQQPISNAPEAVYFKAHVANVPGFAQSLVVEQPLQSRKPSWMMDVDENKREGAPRPAPNRSWNQSFGIRFAPLEQPQASGQSGPKNFNICQHFVQGHCRFGDRCKKIHDLSGQAAQNGNNLGKTKQLNEELQALFRGFNRLNDTTLSELQGNGAIDLFVEFVNDHAAKLLEKVTFASDKEVALSLFANDAVQGMAKRLNQWWAQISRGILKPNNLFDAITSLDLLLSKANQKMAQSGVVASQSQGNVSQVNYFQSGGGNGQSSQGKGISTGNNNDHPHAASFDAWDQQRYLNHHQFHLNERLDRALDEIIARGHATVTPQAGDISQQNVFASNDRRERELDDILSQGHISEIQAELSQDRADQKSGNRRDLAFDDIIAEGRRYLQHLAKSNNSENVQNQDSTTDIEFGELDDGAPRPSNFTQDSPFQRNLHNSSPASSNLTQTNPFQQNPKRKKPVSPIVFADLSDIPRIVITPPFDGYFKLPGEEGAMDELLTEDYVDEVLSGKEVKKVIFETSPPSRKRQTNVQPDQSANQSAQINVRNGHHDRKQPQINMHETQKSDQVKQHSPPRRQSRPPAQAQLPARGRRESTRGELSSRRRGKNTNRGMGRDTSQGRAQDTPRDGHPGHLEPSRSRSNGLPGRGSDHAASIRGANASQERAQDTLQNKSMRSRDVRSSRSRGQGPLRAQDRRCVGKGRGYSGHTEGTAQFVENGQRGRGRGAFRGNQGRGSVFMVRGHGDGDMSLVAGQGTGFRGRR